MSYVDGFVLPVPKKNLPAYKRMAQKAGKIWREHGALEYRECVGDDLSVKMVTSFPRNLKLKRGATVVFAWVVFKPRAHRDRAYATLMQDPRPAATIAGTAAHCDRTLSVRGGVQTQVPQPGPRT